MTSGTNLRDLIWSSESFEASQAMQSLIDDGDSFIDRLPDRPVNPNRVSAIGELALDPEYLYQPPSNK